MPEKFRALVYEMAGRSRISLRPSETLLLIVDVMNDGNREGGFFNKVLKVDISLFQEIEKNLIRLATACKEAAIPVTCVSSVYDFDYIPASMQERLEAMGIRGMDLKGSWGSQVIDDLLLLNPDYILVKCHYSVFSSHRSFVYSPNKNHELEEYLKLPAERDHAIRSENGKTMQDYFSEAHNAARENVDTVLAKGGVVSFDNLLKGKGIKTLIVTGGSTHVCEDAAVNGASERGYNIIEPIDAVASEDFEKHFPYLHNHGLFKSLLTTTDTILEALAVASK